MQRQQPFHDRDAKPGPIMAAVIGRARLEERIADARKVVRGDADAGVFDRHDQHRCLGLGADRDPAAAAGELDRVG